MLTTDSIDPSVKDVYFLKDTIDHSSQNPCQTDDHQSIGSHIQLIVSVICQKQFPSPIFPNEGKTSKYS
jgi:hypothetical protein